MDEDPPYDGRPNAFDELLQELGSQLSKANLDSLEVLERVPEDMREKGGIKLLEYFRNQGRFSLWRTASLHDILRKCGRYDLAQVVKDRYQTNFPDLKESPKAKRSSTQYERTASSLLVRSTSQIRPSSSPILRERDGHRRASSLDHTQWPVEEENTASGTRSFVAPAHTRGIAVSRSPSSEFSFSGTYPPPLEEESSLTMKSNRPNISHRGNWEYRLKQQAIDAVVRIMESKSCTDIPCTKYAGEESGFRSKSEASLVTRGNDSTPTLHRHNPSSSGGGEGDTMSPFVDNNEFGQASPSHASIHVNTANGPPLPFASTAATSRRLKMPRPISGYRKPQDKITWEVKKDRLLKCLNKSAEDQKFGFGEKIDLEVGHGKHNPKLSLVLFPKGLFHYEGKSASLQANISVADKCPPLSPCLLVQMNITVFGTQKQKILSKHSMQENINMRSFYIHDLFSTQLDEISDHILLEISVIIQKATEET